MLPQRYSKPPETGTTQMFFNWKMDKQTAVPPQNKTLPSNEREQPPDRHTAWMSLKCILLSKRSQIQKPTHCMIPLYDILEKA